MVDYDFYTTVFLGNMIGGDDFPRMELRARYHIASLATVPEPLPDAFKMAICAAAEILYTAEESGALAGREITSETVGQQSKSYSVSAASGGLDALLYAAIRPYLIRTGALSGRARLL